VVNPDGWEMPPLFTALQHAAARRRRDCIGRQRGDESDPEVEHIPHLLDRDSPRVLERGKERGISQPSGFTHCSHAAGSIRTRLPGMPPPVI